MISSRSMLSWALKTALLPIAEDCLKATGFAIGFGLMVPLVFGYWLSERRDPFVQ